MVEAEVVEAVVAVEEGVEEKDDTVQKMNLVEEVDLVEAVDIEARAGRVKKVDTVDGDAVTVAQKKLTKEEH